MNIFYIGMRIVCVDTAGLPGRSLLPIRPVRRRVYTVREICADSEEILVRLSEITIPLVRLSTGVMIEPRFYGWRFRPATGCSLFKTKVAARPKPRIKELVDEMV